MFSKLATIENQWLSTLYTYNKACFSKTHLPSHDEQHHLRVWNYAKGLLQAYSTNGVCFSGHFIEQLMLAAFFHDIGMVQSVRPDHGLLGRRMAEDFLQQNQLSQNHFQDALNAIEWHDDKDYASRIIIESQPDVYTILTLADDLDAFGAIGVFRYLEIYYLRAVERKTLREKIINNIQIRCKHMATRIESLKAFAEEQTKRAQTSIDILSNFNTHDLEIILDLIDKEINLNQFASQLREHNSQQLIDWSNKIHQELEATIV